MGFFNEKSDSLFQTIATHNIYFTSVLLDFLMTENLSVEKLGNKSRELSNLIYKEIDNSNGQFLNAVPKRARSATVVVFKAQNNQIGNKLAEECANRGWGGLIDKEGYLTCYVSFQSSKERIYQFINLMRKFAIKPKI